MVQLKKISKIIRLLEKEYGTPKFDHFNDPLEQLILTVLSQNTSWQNCRRAFDNLKHRFENWEEVMTSNVNRIETAIKPGGLGKIKARRIRSILRELWKIKGSLNLNFLSEMNSSEGLKFLNSFKGIGPKTAACVLLFSCKKPVLPVDTHILRVTKRLGLIGTNTNLVQAHELLGQIVPQDNVLSFHINTIQHGRKICKAQKPRCPICMLKSECTFFRAQNIRNI